MAAEWNWADKFDEEEDEDDLDYKAQQWGTRDSLIFLIDCSEAMFTIQDDKTPFHLCIKCAKSSMQNKIISSDKDLLGIVFFATEKHENPSDFKNVYIFHDLDQPGAQRVLDVEQLLEESSSDFKKRFGHAKNFSLSDALWTCSNMFSTCTQKLGYKRILLFTNNDNPHQHNAQLKKQAESRAEDLHHNGIEVELIHMNRPGHKFDIAAFYKELLYADDDELVTMPDPADRFEELLSRVRRKDHKKRALGRIPFNLGENLSFSVGVYTLVRRCDKPAAVKLYKKTNEQVKTVTKSMLADTGEILLPQDIKKSQNYGGRMITFEPEEVTQMKTLEKPGLQLMGFKDKSFLKPYYHIKPSQFVYPDESTVEGSTKLFSALLRKCLDRDVIAVCKYVARRNTSPRFVVLLPQEEQLDDHKIQIAPPGFHVIFLPFADDIRKVPLDEDVPRASVDQIAKAKALVKRLNFNFTPESFENPALQTHYANVEAMALERDAPEEVKDYTMPDKNMDKRAAKEMAEFSDLLFPEGYEPGAKKRAPAGPREDVNVEKEARAGKWTRLTVPTLKDYCKKTGLAIPAGAKKQNFIDIISNHLGLA